MMSDFVPIYSASLQEKELIRTRKEAQKFSEVSRLISSMSLQNGSKNDDDDDDNNNDDDSDGV